MKKKKNSKKRKENSIHIRLEESEARRGKVDILSSELNLLKISRSISNYRRLRNLESEKKFLIAKLLKEIRLNIDKIRREFPHPKLPEILKEKETPEVTKEVEKKELKVKPVTRGNIESQLMEIQEKLARLQSQ